MQFVVTQFFFLESKTAKNMHAKIFLTMSDSYFSFEAIHLWDNEVKRGRTSIEEHHILDSSK